MAAPLDSSTAPTEPQANGSPTHVPHLHTSVLPDSHPLQTIDENMSSRTGEFANADGIQFADGGNQSTSAAAASKQSEISPAKTRKQFSQGQKPPTGKAPGPKSMPGVTAGLSAGGAKTAVQDGSTPKLPGQKKLAERKELTDVLIQLRKQHIVKKEQQKQQDSAKAAGGDIKKSTSGELQKGGLGVLGGAGGMLKVPRKDSKLPIMDKPEPTSAAPASDVEKLQEEPEEDPGCCGNEGYCEKFMRATGFRHFALLLVCSIYALIGAGLFMSIEGEPELLHKRQEHNRTLNDARFLTTNISKLFVAKGCSGEIAKSLGPDIMEILEDYQRRENIKPDDSKTNWDFWGSMFYAGTLFTTIGYGHYAPITDGGRVATIVYALVGIPLVLAMLNDLGIFLTLAVRRPWNKLRRYTIRNYKKYKTRWRQRKQTYQPINANNCVASPSRVPLTSTDVEEQQSTANPSLQKSIAADPSLCSKPIASNDFQPVPPADLANQQNLNQEDEEEDDDNVQFDLPILVAFLFLILWILMSASIFCIWEKDWTYFKAVYFFFISLTTIGLGDVTPDHPDYMIIAFPLVLMGLSFISLVINLFQAKMADLKEQAEEMLEERLGWETETESSSDEELDITRITDIDNQGLEKGRAGGSKSSLIKGGATLGIFSASSDSVSGSRRSSKTHSKPPPLGGAEVIVQRWAGQAKRRKRRGVQTEESFVRQMKADLHRRFPGVRLSDIYPTKLDGAWVKYSQDDISSLIDELDLSLPEHYNLKPNTISIRQPKASRFLQAPDLNQL